jgi:cytochrome c-type biogenesis protein CcmF
VHAFAQSAIGPYFFTFIGITFITSVGLLLYRWGDLKSEGEMKSVLSREALFLLNNLLFLSILVVCFWGVIFPLISELFTGQKVTVGPPFYTRATGPLWAGLMALMAIAPLSAWGHSTIKTLGRALWKPALAAALAVVVIYLSGIHYWIALLGLGLVALVLAVTLYEFWRGTMARLKSQAEFFPVALWRLAGRNRRRYGGYMIHISMVLMAIGIIGMQFYQTQTQGTIPLGGSLSLGDYSLKYDSIAQFTVEGDRQVTRAVVSIYRNGKYVGDLHPRIDYYPDAQQTMTIPGQRSTLADDLYVLLVNWQPVSSQGATFKIYHNPLVNWLWLGALVFILGMLVAAWPDKDPEYIPARAHRTQKAYGTGNAD